MGLKEELEQYLNDEVSAALKSKDISKLMDLHTDDCVVAFPGHAMMNKKEMEEFIKKKMSDGGKPPSMEANIDSATDIGNGYAVIRSHTNGKCMGKDCKMWAIGVLKKEDGKWKVHSRAVGPIEFPK